VGNYEDYLRRELPKFFENALETAVNHEIQPIEERLRRQMVSLLEVAQKLAFSEYRSIMGAPAVNSSMPPPAKDGTSTEVDAQSSMTEQQNVSREATRK
jgi:hypothetical protein